MPNAQNAGFAGPGMMLFSAALFGYFGFTLSGPALPSWAILQWTLRGSAIVFAATAALSFVRPWAANLLYSVAGLIGAALLLLVLVIDLLDTTNPPLVSPYLLVLFAAFNGYGSWTGLRALLGRPASGDR